MSNRHPIVGNFSYLGSYSRFFWVVNNRNRLQPVVVGVGKGVEEKERKEKEKGILECWSILQNPRTVGPFKSWD